MAETVTIGCKLPHGLLCELTNTDGSVRTERIKGSNSSLVIGGYGITEGCDKVFFDEWFKQHKDMAFVKNGLVFVEKKFESAKAHAADAAETTNGLEPLDAAAATVDPLDEDGGARQQVGKKKR